MTTDNNSTEETSGDSPTLMAAKAVAFQSMRADSRVWHEALETAVERAYNIIAAAVRADERTRIATETEELHRRIKELGADLRQVRIERRVDEVRDAEPRCVRWPEMCSRENCVACERIASEYERLRESADASPVGAVLDPVEPGGQQ